MLKLYTVPVITIGVGSQAYPLASEYLPAASITVQAEYNNVGRISIGDSTVTPSTGIQVAPGESAVIEFPASAKFTDEFNLETIFVTSASSGDKVRVVYIKRE